MKKLSRKAAGEADTIGFVAGYGLVVAGAGMVSIPLALVLAGGLLCTAAVLLGRAK